MKHWAFITVGLYLVMALILTVPVFLGYFAGQTTVQSDLRPLKETLAIYHHWGYWVWIIVSVVSQGLLLAVPVAISERRPRSRRHLLVPVITAAFLFALVCVSAVMALEAGIFGDHGRLLILLGTDGNRPLLTLAIYLGVVWAVWALVFYRFAATAEPEVLLRRLMRWLLRGSILELLVAVPSHVVTRHRHDCCAPAISFWGIVTGITVMLLAYGPGVFFLFVERARRLRVKQA